MKHSVWLLTILLSIFAINAQASINQKYGALGPRVSQAEFAANQSESLDILIPLIKRFEGFVTKAHRDHDGQLTIGYGFTHHVSTRTRMSRAQADRLLQILAKETLQDVVAASPRLRKETPEVIAAISDFTFNVGLGAYQGSDVKRAIDKDNHARACTELKGWVYARGRRLSGLVKRRAAECRLLE